MRARRRGEGRLMPGGDGLLPFEARDAAIADIRPLQKYPQEQKLPTHKDNISNYRSSSIEKATDSELFRVSGFSLKTRLHSGTIYVYKRNFS